jgi:hypothetical protein
VLARGFNRIRHYGPLARAACADNIARAPEVLPHDHHRDIRPSD